MMELEWKRRDDPSKDSRSRASAMRIIFAGLGCSMLTLGIIGAFLPVMPTTIFLILAAWCFGKSSPRLEAWMLNHPQFGPSLRRWREEGAVPRKAKLMAASGMAMGYALFWIGAKPHWPLATLVAALIASAAAYVISRPEPSGPSPAMQPIAESAARKPHTPTSPVNS
jgi:uncharacterized membrane protein YbaN (DUF454 family)